MKRLSGQFPIKWVLDPVEDRLTVRAITVLAHFHRSEQTGCRSVSWRSYAMALQRSALVHQSTGVRAGLGDRRERSRILAGLREDVVAPAAHILEAREIVSEHRIRRTRSASA